MCYCSRVCLRRLHLAGRASLPANSMVCPISRVCLRRLWLPVALLYPRIRRSASFRGYACVGCGYRSRFFTREFDVLPHFAGKRFKVRLARLVFLPANSTVCPISRVNELRCVLPDSLLYPRIRWSALFRG